MKDQDVMAGTAHHRRRKYIDHGQYTMISQHPAPIERGACMPLSTSVIQRLLNLFDTSVPYILALDQIDDILGDIATTVADPLE